MSQSVPRRPLPMVREGEEGSATPPPFSRIGIVGLGLIGGSIALAVRRRWPSSIVIAVDTKDVLERAMQLHAIDVGADGLGVVSDAELVILAAPVSQNLIRLSELPDVLPGSALVTDTGGTKREVVARARDLPARLRFIGGHPLGGAARGGLDYARPDLFVGRPWLLTPEATSPEAPDVVRLTTFIEALGAVPRTLSVDDHDHLLAYISHLPQLVSSTLMHVVGEAAGAEGLALTGRGLQDLTRLASSPVDIWRDVSDSNADEVRAALDAIIAVLTELRESVGETAKPLQQVFASANAWRGVLQQSRQPDTVRKDGEG